MTVTGDKLTVKVTPNPTTVHREAEIKVGAGLSRASFVVTQVGMFKLEPMSRKLKYEDVLGDYIFTFTEKGDGSVSPVITETQVTIEELIKGQNYLLKGLSVDIQLDYSQDSISFLSGVQRLPYKPYIKLLYSDDKGLGIAQNNNDIKFSAAPQVAQERLYLEFASKYKVVDQGSIVFDKTTFEIIKADSVDSQALPS